MKGNVSAVRSKFRFNILIGGKIIKEMFGSVASVTPCSGTPCSSLCCNCLKWISVWFRVTVSRGSAVFTET